MFDSDQAKLRRKFALPLRGGTRQNAASPSRGRTAAVVLAMALAASGCAGWTGAGKGEVLPLKHLDEAGFGTRPGAAVSLDDAKALAAECAAASGCWDIPQYVRQIGDWHWFEPGMPEGHYHSMYMQGWAVSAKTGEVRSFETVAAEDGQLLVQDGIDETARLEAWRKLGEIRVPRLEFRNAAPADVLVWLAQAMLAAHPEDCGVSCFGDFSGENAGAEREKTLREAAKRVRFVPPEAMAGLPPVTADLTDVPVRNVALYLGEVWGFRVGLEADGKGWVFRKDEPEIYSFLGGGSGNDDSPGEEQ